MKTFFCLALLLWTSFVVLSVTANILDQCEECEDLIEDLMDCFEEHEDIDSESSDDDQCTRKACEDAKFVFEDCCEECEDEAEEAFKCIKGCTPACVSATAASWLTCQLVEECEDECTEAWNEGLEELLEEEPDAPVIRDRDGNLRLDLGEALVIADEEDVDLDCDDLEDEIIEPSCDLVNDCCDDCIYFYEVFATCMIEKVILPVTDEAE